MRRSADFTVALCIVGAVAAAQTVLGFSLPLLASGLSGQGAGLALIKGAGFVPNILFAIFIGVINDRIPKAAGFRRYTVGLAAAAALLCTAALTERLSLPGLVLFMVTSSALAYAAGNAQMTLIRLTVPRDQLSDATALTATAHAIVATAGPAVASFALLQLGHAGLIAACTALPVPTAAAAFALRSIEALPRRSPSGPRSPRAGACCAPTASSAR